MRLLFLWATLLLAPLAAADDLSARDLFRSAYLAAQAGETASAYEEALRGYVLYPYLEAARLKYRLGRLSADTNRAETDDRIEAFLAVNAELPVARGLRTSWLQSLAARAEWTRFLDRVPADTSDPSLKCQILRAQRVLTPEADLSAALTALWLTPQDLPSVCDELWTFMESRQGLTTALIEQRAQLALDNGKTSLVRALAQRLPPDRALAWTAVAALVDSPNSELPRRLRDGALPPDNGAVMAAFTRMTRRDSAAALEWLPLLRGQERWSEAERHRLTREAAQGLAMDRQPQAVALFREVPDTALDAMSHEWRIRAALWAGDWKQALDWIRLLPDEQAGEARWRYWQARALEATGESEIAQELYKQVSGERETYGFLAAERAGVKLDLRPVPLGENGPAQALLLKNAAFIRARELFLCDLRGEATAEWRFALGSLDAAVRTEAARMAAGWGWHQQAIADLAALSVWNDVALRYPLPFDAEIAAAAKLSELDPDMLYSVLRQESLYSPRAQSSAEAMGLMQLLPATAKAVARRNHLPPPSREDLFTPAINTRLGALYLREQQQRFNGRWIFTLAAYNAGPGRVYQWLPKDGTVPGDVWMENIPFTETRLYVQRILGHRLIFGWRRRGELLPLLPFLSDVTPEVAPVLLPNS